MRTIKFSHRYKKMPPSVEYITTYITDVRKISYSALTPEQIKQDTETIDGQFYTLPKGELIWISLWTEGFNGGHLWQTIRRYTPEKYKYYQSLVGQEVKIEIT